jgi:YidC/Oxa1 family membrane protein insertase
MDKNTLLGLLLMGAVIFGFTYLNQPSAEEIERQRQEQLDELAKASEVDNTAIDTISTQDVAALRNSLYTYGQVDSTASNVRYSYSADGIMLSLQGDSISGSIETPVGSIAVAPIIANHTADLNRNAVVYATQAIRRVINDLGRYKNFAQHLNGNDTVTVLENDVLSLNISAKGGQISHAELKNYDCYLNNDTTNVVLWDGDTNEYSFTLTSNSQRFETRDFYFTPIQENDSTVLMKLDLGTDCWLGIRYSLTPGSYAVRMNVVQHGIAQAGIIPPSVSTMELNWHQ